MLGLLVLEAKSEQIPIEYSSAIQLKSRFTKNVLASSVPNAKSDFETPLIFSSRPPFDDGWTWIVQPGTVNDSFTKESIKCGSNITLLNAVSQFYLSIKSMKGSASIIPTVAHGGASSIWTVQCRDSDIWKRGTQVTLMNPRFNCFLTTSLIQMEENKYPVTCENLSSGGVWAVKNGFFFGTQQKEEPSVGSEL